ncbi:MAG: tetratricopeptide repeat protein [Acidobacteria bacterium]|nr:tetratricopeptide repeat protein [Acidobacteriota bacterium]
MKRALAAAIILLATLVYVAIVARNAAADWLLSNPTPDDLTRELSWNSQDPLLWTAYARQNLYASDFDQAVSAFHRAVALNPTDPANWDGLASAYLQTWESQKAETALRAWLSAVPHSPQAAWRLGNLLILQDRSAEAFPYLKTAASADPRLHHPLFDLAWKISSDSDMILREVVPNDAEARVNYALFLIQNKRLTEGQKVWAEVRGSSSKRVQSLGNYLANVLMDRHMSERAAKVWSDMLDLDHRSSAKPAGELMTNGDFEAGLPNDGLDWRITQGPGYYIRLDEMVAQSGVHSLLIAFDGTANPDFWAVVQRVPVEPNRAYQFRGYMRTEGITTDNGVRFSVVGVPVNPSDRFEILTKNLTATTPWTEERVNVRTGPGIHVLMIFVRRIRSQKLNKLIQGKVWIDNVSVKALP